jgi:hypothetical protein
MVPLFLVILPLQTRGARGDMFLGGWFVIPHD